MESGFEYRDVLSSDAQIVTACGDVAQALRVLRPGGLAIVGTFGPRGPEHCSGLPVARHAPDELYGELGCRFVLVDNSVGVHATPWGTVQQFVYCLSRFEN